MMALPSASGISAFWMMPNQRWEYSRAELSDCGMGGLPRVSAWRLPVGDLLVPGLAGAHLGAALPVARFRGLLNGLEEGVGVGTDHGTVLRREGGHLFHRRFDLGQVFGGCIPEPPVVRHPPGD